MSRNARLNRAARMKSPLRNANFLPKRERKRIRRSLVRGYISNVWNESRVRARERADFYRNLRYIKLRRRKIAAEMAIFADMVSGLRREVVRLGDRTKDVDSSYLDEATQLVKTAEASVGAVAEEFYLFSRARVWYTEAIAS